jgi:HK97 family phage portal protein
VLDHQLADHLMAGRSLLGDVGQAVARLRRAPITDKAPVAYVGRSGAGAPAGRVTAGSTAGLEAYGAIGTLFGVVSKLAASVSQVDWTLHRKAASGREEDETEVARHPALDLFHRPNEFMTGQELRETVQQHVELTGMGYLVVARARSLPIELWPVRPDRIAPVKSATDFISGYVYRDPDGKPVPLAREDVICIRWPSPLDMFGGMSPVAALTLDLEGMRYAQEWNANFFRNSAEPGGVIEFDRSLDDDEFERVTTRWREQHRGVANSHRVAIIEEGKWVDRKYTMRDMEFTSLRGVSDGAIREAWGFPKPLTGAVDDVNRATAEAMDVIYARHSVIPRLKRWQGAMNNDLLKLFGAQDAYCWRYDPDLVPADRTADNADMKTAVDALVALVGAGFEAEAACEYLGLPVELAASYAKPAPPPVQATATIDAPAREAIEARASRPPYVPVVNAETPADDIDLSEVQDDWDEILGQLLADWTSVTADQRDAAVEAVEAALVAGDVTALADIDLPWELGASLLAAAMAAIALRAARQVTTEAGRQGVPPEDIPARVPPTSTWKKPAKALAKLLARWMGTSAGAEALRVNGAGQTPAEVGDRVRAHLNELTDAYPRQVLGGALTGAQNAGRLETMRHGPVGALYASEQLDTNTCKNCRAVHGRWLGNTDDLSRLDQTYPQGAYGGYVDCLGGSRCRGTIVGVWRPKTTSGAGS